MTDERDHPRAPEELNQELMDLLGYLPKWSGEETWEEIGEKKDRLRNSELRDKMLQRFRDLISMGSVSQAYKAYLLAHLDDATIFGDMMNSVDSHVVSGNTGIFDRSTAMRLERSAIAGFDDALTNVTGNTSSLLAWAEQWKREFSEHYGEEYEPPQSILETREK
jgi:hypothetical protein